MKQYTEIQTIRFSKIQKQTLNKLKDYNVDISQFIRFAIKEKINRDYKKIKTELKIKKQECPF